MLKTFGGFNFNKQLCN